MKGINAIKVSSTFIVSTLLLTLSVSAQMTLPKATIDDYVWDIIDESIYPNWAEDCDSEDELKYQDCLDRSLVTYNQRLIKRWQLSKYVSRKLNQTIVRLPNHTSPIILTDEPVEGGEVLKYIYQLDRYDAVNHWLYLTRQVYETNNTVLIDLDSGFIQEFEGSYLTFTPDMMYAVTVVAEFPGEENVIIWKKDKNGSYQFDENSNKDYDKFRQHLDFYNGSESNPMVRKVELEWITNNSLLVDFYFKLNDEDTAAYRVRFNYVKPDTKSDWQIIPIK